jgi:hypothetical protein
MANIKLQINVLDVYNKKNAEAQLRLLHYVNAQKGEKYMKGGSNHLFNSEDEIENFFRYSNENNKELSNSQKTIVYLINYEYPSIDDDSFDIGRNFLRMKLSWTSVEEILFKIKTYMAGEKNLAKDILVSFDDFNEYVGYSYNEKKELIMI